MTLKLFWCISALYLALSYILWIIYFVWVLKYQEVDNVEQKLEIILNNSFSFYWIIFFIYVIFWFILIYLVSYLNSLINKDILINKIISIFWYIWATWLIFSWLILTFWIEYISTIYSWDLNLSLNIYSSINVVFQALWWWSEILGWLWILFISILLLKNNTFSKWLNYLWIIIWLSWVLSIIPNLWFLTMIFWLLQIIWFIELARQIIKKTNNK
jgi:hypothetical protein